MSEVGLKGFYYNEAKVTAGCAGINNAEDNLQNINLSTLTSLENATNFPEFSEIAGGSSYLDKIKTYLPSACNNISELQNIIATVMVSLGIAQTTEDAKEIKSFDITNGSSVQLDEQGLCEILKAVLKGEYGSIDEVRRNQLEAKYGPGIADTVMQWKECLESHTDVLNYMQTHPGVTKVEAMAEYNNVDTLKSVEGFKNLFKYNNNPNLMVYPTDSYYSYENMINDASYYVYIANLKINGSDSALEEFKGYSEKDKAVAQNLLDKYWKHNSDGLQVNDQICEDLLKNGNLMANSKSATSESSNSTATASVTNEPASSATANPSSPSMSASTSNSTPPAAPTITPDEILKYANASIRVGKDKVAMPDSVRNTVQNLVNYAFRKAGDPSAVQPLTIDEVLAIINGQ